MSGINCCREAVEARCSPDKMRVADSRAERGSRARGPTNFYSPTLRASFSRLCFHGNAAGCNAKNPAKKTNAEHRRGSQRRSKALPLQISLCKGYTELHFPRRQRTLEIWPPPTGRCASASDTRPSKTIGHPLPVSRGRN